MSPHFRCCRREARVSWQQGRCSVPLWREPQEPAAEQVPPKMLLQVRGRCRRRSSSFSFCLRSAVAVAEVAGRWCPACFPACTRPSRASRHRCSISVARRRSNSNLRWPVRNGGRRCRQRVPRSRSWLLFAPAFPPPALKTTGRSHSAARRQAGVARRGAKGGAKIFSWAGFSHKPPGLQNSPGGHPGCCSTVGADDQAALRA